MRMAFSHRYLCGCSALLQSCVTGKHTVEKCLGSVMENNKVSQSCPMKDHESTLWKSVLGVYWKRKRYRAYFSQLLFCISRGFSPDNAATRVGSRWSLATATLSSRKRRSPWAETRVNKHPTLTPPPRRGWKKQKNIYTVEYGQKKKNPTKESTMEKANHAN